MRVKSNDATTHGDRVERLYDLEVEVVIEACRVRQCVKIVKILKGRRGVVPRVPSFI